MLAHTTQRLEPIADSIRSIRSWKRTGLEPSLVPSETTTVVGCTTFSAARSAKRPCGVVRPDLASQATSVPSCCCRYGRRPTASESPTTSTEDCGLTATSWASAAAGVNATHASTAANVVGIRRRSWGTFLVFGRETERQERRCTASSRYGPKVLENTVVRWSTSLKVKAPPTTG